MKVGDLVRHKWSQKKPMLGTIIEAYLDIEVANETVSLYKVVWSGAGLDTCFEKNLILVNSVDDESEEL